MDAELVQNGRVFKWLSGLSEALIVNGLLGQQGTPKVNVGTVTIQWNAWFACLEWKLSTLCVEEQCLDNHEQVAVFVGNLVHAEGLPEHPLLGFSTHVASLPPPVRPHASRHGLLGRESETMYHLLHRYFN